MTKSNYFSKLVQAPVILGALLNAVICVCDAAHPLSNTLSHTLEGPSSVHPSNPNSNRGLQQENSARLSVPFVISATQYDDWNEADDIELPQETCQDGQLTIADPDFETTINDIACLTTGNCHVTEMAPYEFLAYNFKVDELSPSVVNNGTSDGQQGQLLDFAIGIDNITETLAYVDITVRVASDVPKLFELKFMNGPTSVQSKRFLTPGLGSDVFDDVTWQGVKLLTARPFHTMRFEVLEYGINICSVSTSYSTSIPPVSLRDAPFTLPALQYDDAFDLSQPMNDGDGCGNRLDGVDSIRTNDELCMQRDNAFCSVTMTIAGEFLSYKFNVPPRNSTDSSSTGMYDIRARVSAFQPDSNVRLQIWSPVDLTSPLEKSFVIPFSENDQELYYDLIWTPTNPLKSGEYALEVGFSSNIEICSVSVLDSQVPPPPTESPTTVPTSMPSLTPTNAPSPIPAIESPTESIILPSDAQSGVNPLNSTEVTFQSSTDEPGVVAPGSFSALSFVGFSDTTSTNDGSCPISGPVDAQIIVTDGICSNAVGNPENTTCTVASTVRDEYLLYRFSSDGAIDQVNLSFRISSASTTRRIQVKMYPESNGPSITLSGPGLGFQNYTTVTWENVGLRSQRSHDLKVTFLDGRVNLCAWAVEYVN